jgi:hypothetical protein
VAAPPIPNHHAVTEELTSSAPCSRAYTHVTVGFNPGTRLGVYEVVQIGEGGMGQVYRATDTTLGRQVAIKILPNPFASDPERLARFEREAKTLASLNHPHIAAIYAVEKSAGMHALVMEWRSIRGQVPRRNRVTQRNNIRRKSWL